MRVVERTDRYIHRNARTGVRSRSDRRGGSHFSVRSRGAAVKIAVFLVVLTLAGCRLREPTQQRLAHDCVIADPCNTFVSEVAPRKTPLLRTEGSDLLLTISFTPALNKEADRIKTCVSLGRTSFVIAPAKRSFRARRVERGYLVIVVPSREAAMELLQALCFSEKEVAFARESESAAYGKTVSE